jgi:hypothetical protein
LIARSQINEANVISVVDAMDDAVDRIGGLTNGESLYLLTLLLTQSLAEAPSLVREDLRSAVVSSIYQGNAKPFLRFIGGVEPQ